MLFDSGSSKTLVHKHVIPCNYTPIQSNDELWTFSFAGTTVYSNLVALQKVQYPEFNHNMVVNKHPVLVFNSTSLLYGIIFAADFLDKCGIILDHDNNLVHWME